MTKFSSTVQFTDVASGVSRGDLPLPVVSDNASFNYFQTSKQLRYCDGGKYLLIFDFYDKLYAVDTRTSTIRASWNLRSVLGDPTGSEEFGMDCAGQSSLVALRLDSQQNSSVRLIDLEKKDVVVDLTKSFNEEAGYTVAISPDGTHVALQFSGVDCHPDGSEMDRSKVAIQVVDTQGGGSVTLCFPNPDFPTPPWDNQFAKLAIRFAGNDGLLMGKVLSGAGGEGWVQEPFPRLRTVEYMDLRAGVPAKTLAIPGLQTYRFFGSSADGNEVFSYTGEEKFCSGCNDGHGEMRVKEARFTIWNPRTGKILVQSAALPVPHQGCPFITLGSCEAYDQLPYLEMSQGGHAVLAFGAGGASGCQTNGNCGSMRVYSW